MSDMEIMSTSIKKIFIYPIEHLMLQSLVKGV